MGEKQMPFSGKDLREMIVPLFLEQLLVMLVGIADTLVVSYAGEAAVSGVSLVNQFNTIFIYLFTALASGGAVVISQYIGRKEQENAGRSASQLLMFGTVFSLLTAVLVLVGNKGMLRLLFGRVEDSVMDACVTYLKISAYSYPALAVYHSGAAVYRSLGKTNVTMYISVLSNIINAAGNVIGVFVLHAGVGGSGNGTCLYHRGWTVHGKSRYRGGRLLSYKISKDNASAVLRVESAGIYFNPAVPAVLCAGGTDKAACNLAGIDS